MPTDLQKDLAEAIVENAKLPKRKRKNKKELVVSVGYDVTTAEKNQTRTIMQKGVKIALKEWGLDEGLITSSLVEDIKAKPQKRLGELSLGAEILGMKQKEGNAPILNISQLLILINGGTKETGQQGVENK